VREDTIQRLAFSQAAHVVQAYVESLSFALVTLNTTARLLLTFENQYPLASLCQQVGANESAKTASYDDHIVSHAFLFRLSHR
jgi:hypothetical protein